MKGLLQWGWGGVEKREQQQLDHLPLWPKRWRLDPEVWGELNQQPDRGDLCPDAPGHPGGAFVHGALSPACSSPWGWELCPGQFPCLFL